MGEMEYKYGCNNCGRYVEVKMKSGFGEIGKMSDEDLPKDIQKICICKTKGEK